MTALDGVSTEDKHCYTIARPDSLGHREPIKGKLCNLSCAPGMHGWMMFYSAAGAYAPLQRPVKATPPPQLCRPSRS